MKMRRKQSSVLLTALACFNLIACRPRVEDCRALMPLAGEAVTIVTTPSGTTGCTTNIDGITVTTELHRDGLHWQRGQTWVDGNPTEASEVHNTIAAIKAKREVETRVAAAEAAATTAVTKATEAGKKLLDRLRK